MSRYNNRIRYVNNSDFYLKIFKDRGVKYIRQYSSPNMSHPTVRQRASLQRLSHIWSFGDKFYKLAHKHYGDSRLWWVIAWYNQLPTEHHVQTGQKIKIPLPAENAISILLESSEET